MSKFISEDKKRPYECVRWTVERRVEKRKNSQGPGALRGRVWGEPEKMHFSLKFDQHGPRLHFVKIGRDTLEAHEIDSVGQDRLKK